VLREIFRKYHSHPPPKRSVVYNAQRVLQLQSTIRKTPPAGHSRVARLRSMATENLGIFYIARLHS